ncbi:MAG: diacylglycerol kinase family protein [Flavobacteriaceae bacterium]
MRGVAVLNRDSGGLRSVDPEAYGAYLRDRFEARGHALDVVCVAGGAVDEALRGAVRRKDTEFLVAAGGDGTISGAARLLAESGQALGVVPAGTMNLFARTLGVPLDIYAAADALAAGSPGKCDIGSANGVHFVHQFSVGLQARMIRERAALDYSSRLGKMLASARATLAAVRRPPHFPVTMRVDGNLAAESEMTLVTVSNNPYGQGHMPYADAAAAGVLGVYWAGKLDAAAAIALTSDLLVGTWDANDDFIAATARTVELEFPRLNRRSRAVIDGELVPLERRVELRIHPGGLNVLLPAESD